MSSNEVNWKDKFQIGKKYSFKSIYYHYICQGFTSKNYPIFEYVDKDNGEHRGVITVSKTSLDNGTEVLEPVKHTWHFAIYRLRNTGVIGGNQTSRTTKEELEEAWPNAECLEIRTIEYIEKK